MRPGHYATEINIYNFQIRDAKIEKRVVPLVLAGAARGREPATSTPIATDTLLLPALSGIMDDCCRINELLFGKGAAASGPISIGILEIVSPVELKVTAVDTVTDLKSNSVAIDVQNIEPGRSR